MIGNIMNVAQMQAHSSDHMGLFCPATELLNLVTPHDRHVQELLLRSGSYTSLSAYFLAWLILLTFSSLQKEIVLYMSH